MRISSWKSWEPADYFREYFSQQVEPDEEAGIRFQVDFLRRAGREFPQALDYGCGPTLMRAIAASRYVAALDMADRLDGNLQRVRRWASGDPQADDWSRFTEYVLQCEGVAKPSREEVLARELRTRRVLSEFLLTDARERNPLGPARVAAYDLLISSFCVDCLSQSKAVWRRCMSNVFRLLKPGGSFVVQALRSCEGYRVGGQWFPGANIQSSDFESVLLECGADLATLKVEEHDLPSHASQGYEGMLMASGQTSST
jgi:SAM-dependent methyltransferase